MKKRLVLLKSLSFTFIFALSLFLNGSKVYAAAAGSTVGISALPSTTQNEFYSILENLLKSLFDTSSSRTITVTGEDGNQYTYDFNNAFDVIQSQIDGNYDIVQAELGELYPEVPDDVTFSIDYTFVNSLPAGLQIIFRPLLTHVCTLWYQSTVHTSSEGGSHGGSGRRRLSAADYSSAVNDILNDIYVNNGSSIMWDMKHVNGVPQNEITVNQDYVVSVFDFLGLDYKMFTSPNDLVITTDLFDNTRLSTLYYTPFFITENNDLYILNKTVYQWYYRSSSSGVGGHNRFYIGDKYFATAFDWNNTIKGYFSFRFFTQDTSLYLGFLRCYSSSDEKNNVYWDQYIISDPEISNAPILFEDQCSLVAQSSPYEKVVSLKTENQSVEFFKASEGSNSTKFDYSDILDEDIAYSGYFYGDNSIVGYNTSIIQSAGQMLFGTENAISGGGQTITSGLSDWQKAIYMLAQQQGTTYEELLEKLDMIIDAQGNITISGADGIEYSVNELSKSFDEIYSKVENISGDLSELLEYLKSLNIEGLGSHIAALEGTLNDLNERDKEREAVYGDMLGKLDELNKLVGSLNLDDLKSISADISDIKNSIKDFSIAAELDITESINKFETPSSITTKFPFSLPFDIYNIFNIFSASPQAPKFTIPLDFTSIGGECYDIVIDLSQYEWIANIVRWVLYAVFIVGLIILTNKLIGRG